MHLKRQTAPNKWPIKKKGMEYVVKPVFGSERGISVLLAVRDFLKIAKTRKEVKIAIHNKHISLNKKLVKNDNQGVSLFDILTIEPMKKSYRLELSENGKFAMVEINEKESNHKISKVIGKKILKGRKIQLNLMDGSNLLSDMKCNVNDSVLVNFKDKKIEKCIPMKEKSNAFVYDGKHAGNKGKIEKIDDRQKSIEISTSNGKSKEVINVLIKHAIVTE